MEYKFIEKNEAKEKCTRCNKVTKELWIIKEEIICCTKCLNLTEREEILKNEDWI